MFFFPHLHPLFFSHTQTYTVVPCMQEVKEFFCALLLGVGPGVDPGFTDLQTLLVVHTVFSLLTLDSYRF